jgi:transposase
MKKLKVSYQGEKVYVGIDVHKKTYSVTVICEGVIIKRDKMNASEEGLCLYIKKYFSGAEIFTAYEAGFSGFGLHRRLEVNGFTSIVVNAASIEVAANDKVKTDLRDSKKLAEQLSHGKLKGIAIPSPEQEYKRSLSRTREQLLRDRKGTANQIKSRMHYFGLMKENDDRVISDRYLKELEGMELAEELRESFSFLIALWRFLNGQMKAVEEALSRQSEREDPKVEGIYRSVPGVGRLSSRVLANELGNLSERFENQKQIYRYTGLTPSEYSSGERVHRGNISRQGSARIRCWLTEIAWRAIKIDPALKAIFDRIQIKSGSKRAIVAVARNLMGRMLSCFKHNRPYVLGVCG